MTITNDSKSETRCGRHVCCNLACDKKSSCHDPDDVLNKIEKPEK